MILKNWHFLVFLISFTAIVTALIAEFFFNLQPCELCLKQRHPYYFIIFVSIVLLIIPIALKLFVYTLIQLSSIYGLFYSIWHVGIENKLLKGPAGCAASLEVSSNTNDLKQQILSKQVVSCEEVVWSLFGLSAASINVLVLLFIFVFNAIYIFNNYGQKKETTKI